MKKNENVVKRLFLKGVFPHQMSFILLIPLRNLLLSPGQLVKRLELRSEDNVLEVGCGPGYFSPAVAGTLTAGKLVLADIQQEMLDRARRRMQKKGAFNAEYYLCDGFAFNFPDALFDRIFMINVIGEVENKEAYIKGFDRILKPGGILSISELVGNPDKLTVNEMKALLRNTNLEFCKLYGNRINYTVNFKKK